MAEQVSMYGVGIKWEGHEGRGGSTDGGKDRGVVKCREGRNVWRGMLIVVRGGMLP